MVVKYCHVISIMATATDMTTMNLKVMLPFRVFSEESNVVRVVAETSEGSLGLLPHRLDCIAVMVPGIVTYETSSKDITYLAVDNGLLIKKGQDVTISVHNAIGGRDLGKLQEAIENEFKDLDEKERDIHSVLTKLETGFFRTLEKFREE